ncbi:MAG: helix-turn-helix domain-containing protein [Acidobacteria bacterium]|nr:helix-turn-helix domain-containing protein [Acidobacteriota bacterium]
MNETLDFDTKYRAVLSRDRRFDGWFIVGVTSTGIYCRPSCPTPIHPKPSNVEFFATAAAAQRHGLRSCKRCRPDAVPGSPELTRRDDLATRALRLITDGVVDRDGVSGLAAALTTGVRQLNRALVAELGASPLELARAQRAHNARVLIETTEMSFAEIAFAAGFGSIRQFNDTFMAVYDLTPSQLRRRPAHGLLQTAGTITLRLPHREPIALDHLFRFHAKRAIAGIEEGDHRQYRRWLRAEGGPAHLELEPADGHILAHLRLHRPADLAQVVNRCRAMFDLDADPVSIADHLRTEPVLGPLVTRNPGLRSPGCADPFEAVVRAIVGQQVTVSAACTTIARLTAQLGEAIPHTDARLFPTPEAFAGADPSKFAMPVRRAAALTAIGRAVLDGDVDLHLGADPDELCTQLRAIDGIGPWTANYVLMRGLSHPDIYLAGDLIIERSAARLGVAASDTARWAPWRSYATHHIWNHSLETNS